MTHNLIENESRARVCPMPTDATRPSRDETTGIWRSIALASEEATAEPTSARLIANSREDLTRLSRVARQAGYRISLRDNKGVVLAQQREQDGAPHDSCAEPNPDSGAVAPIYDDEGAVIAELLIAPVCEQSLPLARGLLAVATRSIEERCFRDRYRANWTIATRVRELGSTATMLFAVNDARNIVGADRSARQFFPDLSGLHHLKSLWSQFKRNESIFRSPQGPDVTGFLVEASGVRTFVSIITPPEDSRALWCDRPGANFHTRPRIDIFDALARDEETNVSHGGLSPSAFQRIRHHIDTNIEQSLEVGGLAHVVGLSRGHFSCAFKESTGTTPHNYVIQQRLARAQRLMIDTDLPLAEIATACGFSDQAHLTRRFQQCIGLAPGEFRRERR